MDINKIKELEEIEWKLVCQKLKMIKERIRNEELTEFQIRALKRQIEEEIRI